MRYIFGGIGDFLQSVDGIKAGEKVRVYSHFKDIEGFFKPLGVDSSSFYFEDSSFARDDYFIHSSERVKRSIFQNFKTPEKSVEMARRNATGKGRIIGIHPVGSKFSNEFYSRLGLPVKFIPPSLVKKIINKDNYYFIFGTTEELKQYKREIEGDNIFWVEYDNIWDSLCHVLFCEKIVAIDSSVKTMASVKRIPTTVLLGDFKDDGRDFNFINPYVEAGVMKIFKFKDITKEENEILNFLNKNI